MFQNGHYYSYLCLHPFSSLLIAVVVFTTILMVCDCAYSVAPTYLSNLCVYLLPPSQVVSICDLQRLALYWFHAPGLQLDNEVSKSTDQPHGTVCHQHYGHRTCRRAPSRGH